MLLGYATSAMIYPSHEPTTDFNFRKVVDAVDGTELESLDDQFWKLESEILLDLLRWMLEGQSLAYTGARVTLLVLYLRPEMVRISSLRELSKMPDAPSCASLSKALLELQQKFGLRPAPFQKPQWARESYRRSAPIGHANRTQ